MSMSELLRGAMKRREPVKVLDSTGDEPALSGADDYTLRDIKLSAIAVVQQWAETDDLDDGESYADRLMAMFVGIADANHDGDVTEDEQGVLEVALNAAWDYLVKAGVTEEDAGALLNDWDDDAADRVRDLVASVLPDGDDAASAEIDSFVFSDDDNAPALDAVYRKTVAVRNGKKVRINKRISGTVRLSAKQKVAIRKARMKSHSAGAMMRRLKSMRLRRKAGL
ncbi:hypothetical protein OE519_00465 [Pseudomonas aeruginosa]|jgi:hypothetical protein|uniref:hypothetical protein n=1 Tax=Pseudomonadota TaxID=1224 RepID=UPI000B4144E0|nr:MULTISPECIES: hypothetical protein [Pseudomonadota]MBH4492671.1 hypothetical protein [Pseudomonas aeruginosa]MCU8942241.1 hypothetical protein [Pseudomonas aeruginosa]MDH1072048.1 hypothetical protein [Pseudomonas nitroreducens]MDN8030294.1 hypothetical protein [Burkholderia multivorans]OVZ64171.1 hypothetical protein CDO44_01995 [Pigmentiphaga sp. NML080357]